MGGKRQAEAPLEGRRRSSRLQDKAHSVTHDEEPPSSQSSSIKSPTNQTRSRMSPTRVQHAAIEIAPAKPKRFRRPRQRKSCGFLHKLPGEIRNRIYRYALIEIGDIKVTPKGPGEPSLLRVCKRFRNEASSIYYVENTFNLQIQNFDGADFEPFIRQCWWYGHLVRLHNAEHSNISMSLTGSPDWDNLVAWIKSNHWNFSKLTADGDAAVGHCFHFYRSAFKLAETMSNLPWTKVEQALKALRAGLKGMPSPWSEDWDEDDWW